MSAKQELLQMLDRIKAQQEERIKRLKQIDSEQANLDAEALKIKEAMSNDEQIEEIFTKFLQALAEEVDEPKAAFRELHASETITHDDIAAAFELGFGEPIQIDKEQPPMAASG